MIGLTFFKKGYSMYLVFSLALIVIVLFLHRNSSILTSLTSAVNQIKNQLDLIVAQNRSIQESTEEFNNEELNNKHVKAFSSEASSHRSGAYMDCMRGHIEPFKLFDKDYIFWRIDHLPSKDIHSYVQKGLLIYFMSMLKENKLDISDLKIDSSYEGNGPHEFYYIKFKVLDYKYEGWGTWQSEGTIEVSLKDGTTTKLKMISYHDNLTDYYETDEYEEVYFFDALKRSYDKFKIAHDVDYRDLSGYVGAEYVFSINDLFNHYNMIGQEFNVELISGGINLSDEFDWRGDIENAFNNPSIIDEDWSILPLEDREVYLLNNTAYQAKKEKLIQKYSDEENTDPDYRFIFGTLNYYNIIDAYNKLGDEKHYINKAIEIWEDLAIKNHPYSLLVLGILYNDGIHVLKNTDKSKECLQKAYANGFKNQSIKVWNDFKYE